jgi:hypothetical protein
MEWLQRGSGDGGGQRRRPQRDCADVGGGGSRMRSRLVDVDRARQRRATVATRRKDDAFV